MLENFPKGLVFDGHVGVKEKLSIVRKYNLQKNNVLKVSLSISKSETSCAEDVDLRDLIKAANIDREKGWNSYQIIGGRHGG